LDAHHRRWQTKTERKRKREREMRSKEGNREKIREIGEGDFVKIKK
jgi:hypothetical protein